MGASHNSDGSPVAELWNHATLETTAEGGGVFVVFLLEMSRDGCRG